MDDGRIQMLEILRQQHIINDYDSMPTHIQSKLNDQLDILQLDFLDLNIHKYIYKNDKFNKLPLSLKPIPQENSINLNKIEDFEKAHAIENSMEAIAKGQLAVVINAGGTQPDLDLGSLKLGVKVSQKTHPIGILSMFVERIRSLGEEAIRRYGRNFLVNEVKEPIEIILVANEDDYDNIQTYLVSEKYFNYTRFILFPQVPHLLPNLRCFYQQSTKVDASNNRRTD